MICVVEGGALEHVMYFFQDMPIDIETYQFTTFINISTFLHLGPLSVEFVNFLKLFRLKESTKIENC